MGFHVHFGLKPKVISPEYVVPYLDNYLGSISLLLENYGEGVNRRSYKKSPGGNPVSYGKMGDFRTKPHGFEYRPISSCISSPYVTLSLLCLAKAIVFEALNNKAFKPRLLVEHDDFTHMNIAKIKTNFPQIWQDITQLHLYPKYKSHIDFLLFLIQNKDSWKQGNEDFKLNWGIINSSKYFKKNDLYIKLPVNIKPVIEEEVDNEKPGKILQLEDIWGEMILGKNNQF